MVQDDLEMEIMGESHGGQQIVGLFGCQNYRFLSAQVRQQGFQLQVALGRTALVFIFVIATGFFLLISGHLLIVILRVEERLSQLGGHAHTRRRIFAVLKAFVAALPSGKVQRHGNIAHHDHLFR